MKKLLLSLFVAVSAVAGNAQCNPLDYNFGAVAYGVYPDTATGLTPAYLNQPYTQVIYMLVPTDAGLIDPAYAGVPISTIELNNIQYDDGTGTMQDVSNLGLTLACNPTNCTFDAGGQYCGSVSGIPNTAGSFPVTINVTANITFFGVQIPIPYAYTGYTFVVNADASVSLVNNATFEVGMAKPNPANNWVNVPFESPAVEEVEVVVTGLLGNKVFEKTVTAKRGENQLAIETSNWEEGVYLYTVQSGSTKVTRRLLVQH
ncbi:MAG: hypothetical protein RL362_1101 [Bacteroidota bacterium]